ncbi:hypothetical protein F4818DRAFT_442705 [Hypoxylon cercidicola]|nr:hypothetical protein F4818DRAFT_442705 [Hypoxylon cercidicola]
MAARVLTLEQFEELCSAVTSDVSSPWSIDDLPGDETCRTPIDLPPGVSAEDFNGVPTIPPPGLSLPIGIEEYMRPRVLKPGDIVMFHQMAEHFTGYDKEGNRVILKLKCIMCNNRLDVPKQVAPRAKDGKVPEPFTVLPCGHFFGSNCLGQWEFTRNEEGLEPDCPYCRFSLVHPECGHDIQLNPYDPRFPRSGQTPPTFPENGVVAISCESCAKMDLAWYARRLVQRVYPNIPDEVFNDPDVYNSATFKEFRHCLWESIEEAWEFGKEQFDSW